uniref:Uncharacterized protein n=1 Tax=Fagus sylvatica TaxID=28930 RepID=A0A2N9GV41_FAGSY
MDALELPYHPVDVAGPKLMGSEGFGRAAGVSLNKVEARQTDAVSVLVSPTIQRCSSLLTHKDVTTVVKASDSASCDTELYRHASQLPSFRGDDVSENLYSMDKIFHIQYPRPEGVQLPRKAAKLSRSGVSSKRPRLAQMEDSMSLAGVDDKKDVADKPGSYPTTCTSPENTQLVKQKSNSNKRGDKRGFKVPAKIKYDSFSMKAGLSNFSSAVGGVYGLKLDTHDTTKLMDDPPLNNLLDGTYKCSSLVKDKGKKAANVNDDFLHSVRKAFSILHLSRPIQSQNIADIDSCSKKKMSTCLSSSVSGDKGEPCMADLCSCNKDSCSKPDTPANPLDLPLCQPKDILKRVVLPQPKDLESLLLDAAKSSVSSRNTSDIRSGKQMSRRVSLPPFPWSHSSSGHCRTNSDAIKLTTTKSTCQGRWVRIGNVSSSLIATDFLTNLESLTYDQSLVPSGLSSENKISQSLSVSLPQCECDLSSSTTCSKASHILFDSGGKANYQGNAGQCPILIAAQTLCDMATHSFKGLLRWPKKPSQKVMKARKLKPNEKLEETFARSIPVLGSNNLVRSVDQLVPSKKQKLSTIENSKDLDNSNYLRKGPINWSTPRSSRSSPGKSIKDSIVENRHSTASILKQSCMMPPPARVFDKACTSQQKARKLLPMDWNRGRDGLD